jgi:toxin ParE1/3/4
MRLIFAKEAKEDLIRIGDAITQFNPLRAISFVDELAAKCEVLKHSPLIYSLVPGHETEGIRRIVHGNNLIFYRTHDDRVEVLHVLHGAMNYQRVLFPE